jgi:cell division protein FtsQ
MTAAAPRIDPRLRERRAAVARAAGRRRLRVLLVVTSVMIVTGLAYLGASSPFFDVDHIEVVGASPAVAGEVRAHTGVHMHDALAFLDTGAIARRVERLPWVAHASVHRTFPGTLRVTVKPYTPAAFVRLPGHGVVLVARNGRVFAGAKAPPPGAVEIRGVRRAPKIGGSLAPAIAARVMSQLPRPLAARVHAVDVSGDGLALVLGAGGTIRLGSGSALGAKSQAALAVLARIGTTPFVYLDVSTPQTPVLQR